jgi:DNA-binding XRE family transcriptional regulator
MQQLPHRHHACLYHHPAGAAATLDLHTSGCQSLIKGETFFFHRVPCYYNSDSEASDLTPIYKWVFKGGKIAYIEYENENYYHDYLCSETNNFIREFLSMHSNHEHSPEGALQNLGNRLRCLRKARKLRQLDMEDFGLSYKYYQRLESGHVNPTLLTLHKVASALDVSVYDLFCPGQSQDPQIL